MTEAEAVAIAHEWIAAWNSHDIERILSHYADGIELTSPLADRILGSGQSTVKGIENLRGYFLRALAAYPDLKFTYWGAYPDHESVVVHYESVRRLRATEFMRLDNSGRVCEVVAHYAAPTA